MNDFIKNNINTIINDNNINVLQKMPDMCISGIVSDCPYALSDINPLAMIKDGVNNKSGFMGKAWDCLPTVEMLKEFYRVLKTGGFFVTTFTPRQDLQTVFLYRLMEAGFDVSFSPLYFCYKQGFPKASNYGKVIDKHFNAEREVVGQNPYASRTPNGNNWGCGSQSNAPITKPTTPEAKYCDGLYSLSLKPALEPIIIAQKPHNKAKYKQALDWYYERKELLDKGIKEEDLSLYTKNASGGVWIDNGRIPTSQEDMNTLNSDNRRIRTENISGENFLTALCKIGFKTRATTPSQGRFPANLLCGFPISKEELRSEYPDATEEELDKMVTMIENPLDTKKENLSRYFSLTAWNKKHFPNLHNIAEKTLQLQDDVKKTGDCLFVNKPSQAEKNAGLEGFESKNKWLKSGGGVGITERQTITQNTHPTTKPIVLYNYLIALFSKEGDIILDPFCGSGATPIACVLTNRRYIGIEMSEEYHKIAEARVEHYKQQKEAMKIPSASKKNVSASKSIDTNQGSLI